jgi:hypothetical protein
MRTYNLLLAGMMLAVPSVVLAHDRDERDWPKQQCITDGFGDVECGYSCVVGGDGHGNCARTPSGACKVDGRGRAICSR